MPRKILKSIFWIIVCFLICFIYIDQNRDFYCLNNNNCITVWKRIGGKCYILPYRYYSVFKPNDNFIKVPTNDYPTGLIFENDVDYTKIVVDRFKDDFEIVNNARDKYIIINYKDFEQKFDSIYTYREGHYRKYKDDVVFLSVNSKENYVSDRNGILKD